MTKRFPNNGHVDSFGRLTAKGRAEVEKYLAKYPQPAGIIFDKFPDLGNAATALIQQGTLALDDLHQTAALAVVDGIMNFDPDNGAGLTTFVVWKIRGAVTKLVDQNNRRVPTVSYQTPAGGDGDTLAHIMLEMTRIDDLDTAVEPYGELTAAVRRLSPVQREVLVRRAINGETQAVLGEDIGVCKQRIQQIEAEACIRIGGIHSHRRLAAFTEKRRRKPAPFKGITADGICRHCRENKECRPRGLCTRCHEDGDTRDQYPTTGSKYGRRLRFGQLTKDVTTAAG
jgi:RNA polymerase sigma factor (sigma-70 family)